MQFKKHRVIATFRRPDCGGVVGQTRADGEILSKNVLVQSLFVFDNDVAVKRRLQTKSELKVIQWSAQRRISHGMQFSIFPFPIQIFLFQCNFNIVIFKFPLVRKYEKNAFVKYLPESVGKDSTFSAG